MERDSVYYGKMTKELKNLYERYEKKWGYSPDGCEDVEYDDDDYEKYIYEIKQALELGVEFPLSIDEDEDDEDYDDGSVNQEMLDYFYALEAESRANNNKSTS